LKVRIRLQAGSDLDVSRNPALVAKGIVSPDTWKVILGKPIVLSRDVEALDNVTGFADDEYTSLLESVDDIQRDNKLIVLRTSPTLSARLKKLDLCTIKAPPGIFEVKSIAPSAGASDALGGRSDALGGAQTISPPSSPVRSRPLASVSQRWMGKATSEAGPKYLNPNIVEPITRVP
jgi:hypothetical protein